MNIRITVTPGDTHRGGNLWELGYWVPNGRRWEQVGFITILFQIPEEGIEIGLVHVNPEWRQRGIGTFLLRSVLERADRLGYACDLHVEPEPDANPYEDDDMNREDLCAWYEAHGFSFPMDDHYG